MAVLSDLVETIAEVEHLDPAAVGLIARYIREAGLIATRGRGPSAAKMGVTDAANLLIGVNATSGGATKAPRTVKTYRRLQTTKFDFELEAEWNRGTLGDAVEQLVDGAARGELADPFLGRELGPDFQEAFSRGDVHIELRFRKSAPAAHLAITVWPDWDVIKPMLPEPWLTVVPAGIRMVFLPHTAQRPPPAKSKQPDRIEETAIGYATLRAIGKLIG